jgi:invasion protein IalB
MSLSLCAWGLVCLQFPTELCAQTPPTITTYGDWKLVCERRYGPNNAMICTSMFLPPRNDDNPMNDDNPVNFDIRVGRLGDGKIHIYLSVPANVWLEGGVLLFSESSERLLAAPFRWCILGSCTADAELTAVDIEKLRSQTKPARMTYKVTSENKVTLPVSFVGFGDALGGVK